MARQIIETHKDLAIRGSKCGCGCGDMVVSGEEILVVTLPTNVKRLKFTCACKGNLLKDSSKEEKPVNNSIKHEIKVEVLNADAHYLSDLGYKVISHRKGYKTMTKTYLNKRSSGKVVYNLLEHGYNVYCNNSIVNNVDDFDNMVAVVNIRRQEAMKNYR